MEISISSLKLLLNSGLFIAIIALSASENSQHGINISENLRLPDYIVPIHYDIKLTLFANENRKTIAFSVKYSAVIDIRRTTQFIGCHFLRHRARPSTIELIKQDTENNMTNVHKYNLTELIYNKHTNMYVLYINNEVPSGIYILNMQLHSKTHDNEVIFETSYINRINKKMLLVATNFQPIGARRMFPCWDEPQFKATFNISVRHYSKYMVISNMPVKNVTNLNAFVQWIQFETTPIMPTYLVALAVIDLPIYFYDTKIAIFCRQEVLLYVQFAWTIVKSITNHLKVEWTSSMEISKMSHVIMPTFLHEGISNWGLIFYRETAITYNEHSDPIARKIEVAYLVARQIAYQWFGNMITPSWWSHLWLHESLATFFGVDTIDKTNIFANSQIMHLFVVQNQHESLHLDSLQLDNMHEDSVLFNTLSFVDENPSQIKSFFSFPRYRGVCILRMWQHVISDKIFREGVHRYLNTHAFNSTTSDDFWAIMHAVLIESYPMYDINLPEIMNSWANLWHYPVINVTRNNNTHVILNVKVLQLDLWIPVTYTTQSDPNFTKTFIQYIKWQQSYWPIKLYVKNTDWIIVNLQQTGYYRVNYDVKNWQNIISYLKSENYTKIHVLNRAKLIDDAFHLMMIRELNSSIFWELTEYLSQETDYIAWYPMIKALEYMSRIFAYSDEAVKNIKERIQISLHALLKNITYQENPSETYLTKCLRQEAIKWACTLGSKECNNNISSFFLNHIKDPVKYRFTPGWEEWTYCTGMKDYLQPQIMPRLKYFCYGNADNILDYMSQIYTNKIQIDRRTRISVFFSAIVKHAKVHKVLDYILKNIEKEKASFIDRIATIIHVINNVSEEEFEKIQEFALVEMEEQSFSIDLKLLRRMIDIKRQMMYLQIVHPKHERQKL